MIADNAIQTVLPVDVPQTKRCTKCGEVKAIGEFYIHSVRKDGLKSHCKKCERKHVKTLAYPRIENGIKKCPRCGEEKKAFEFPSNMRNKDGLDSYCKECNRANSKHDYDNRSITKPRDNWAMLSLRNHRSKGYFINIEKSELIEMVGRANFCSICGVELDWAPLKGKSNKNSPSWDRIFNGNRLTANNTWIICRHCNTVKHDLPMPEFVAYCKMVADKFGGEYL